MTEHLLGKNLGRWHKLIIERGMGKRRGEILAECATFGDLFLFDEMYDEDAKITRRRTRRARAVLFGGASMPGGRDSLKFGKRSC